MRTFKNLNNLTNSSEIIELLQKTATPLDNPADLDPLMNQIGDAKYLLLGEASMALTNTIHGELKLHKD